MKILFAAGGTGGHINPALAIAGTIKSRHPEAEILFAGTPWGMEAKFVPNAGYNFVPIKVRGIERKLSIKSIKNNVKTAYYLLTSGKRAKKIIKDFNPDIPRRKTGFCRRAACSGRIVLCFLHAILHVFIDAFNFRKIGGASKIRLRFLIALLDLREPSVRNILLVCVGGMIIGIKVA